MHSTERLCQQHLNQEAQLVPAKDDSDSSYLFKIFFYTVCKTLTCCSKDIFPSMFLQSFGRTTGP